MAFGKFFTWQRSSIAWFLFDFFIGVSSVILAYWWQDLPIDNRNLMSWHPGAIPASVIYGLALGIAFYALGGDSRIWQRSSGYKNFLSSLLCVGISTVAVVLFFWLFLMQVGRIVVLSVAVQSFLCCFIIRTLMFSRHALEKRSLLLIMDEDHQPSPQMEELIEVSYNVVALDLSVIEKSSVEHLVEEWLELGIQDVVFVVRCDSKIVELLLVECWKNGIRFVEWNYFVEANFRKLNVYDQHLDWLMHLDHQYAHPAYSKVKRAFDIFCSVVGILLAWPLLLLGMFLVLVSSGRPVFFKQDRLGPRGQVFSLWKLRTMVNHQSEKESKWSQEGGDKRITKVGKFLRRTRIDELPQLFHVFSGDMSLVGPRPEWTEVAKHWEKEIPFYQYRTMVKPGLTGWAQINFSYAETKDEVLEKLSYDFFYIKHASVGLDLRILLRTFSAMFEGGR